MGRMKDKDIRLQELEDEPGVGLVVDPGTVAPRHEEAVAQSEAEVMVNKDTGELIDAPSGIDMEWPEGFEPYDLSYDNYEAWDWDKSPMLIGKVTNTRVIPMMRRGKQTEVKMLVVLVGNTEYALWETAQLKQLMDKAFVSMQVAIKYIGMEELAGGKRLRKFEARTRGQ